MIPIPPALKYGPLLIIALLLTACSTLKTTSPSPTSALPAAAKNACLPALTELDQLAAQHAGTLSDHRIANTPWLRNNRFLHSFQQQNLNQPQLHALLTRMNQRAIDGLGTESRHIPVRALQHWQMTHQLTSPPAAFIHSCATQLLRQQLAQPKVTSTWLKQLKVSDSYSTLQRVLGLYPFAAIPFRWGVVNEQMGLQQQWGNTQGRPWAAYTPASGKVIHRPRQLRKDALNIPLRNAQETRQLLMQHAPTWLIDSQSTANKPGAPYWRNDELAVDTGQPVTYTHLSFGRWQNQITTQLNYIIWFTERPALSTFDWVAGKHDALIFRVHLDAAENILAYDSIHLCGCWYRLFLPEGTSFKTNTAFSSEPVIAEQVRAARQMRVYINRDTHQIIDLKPATGKIVNARPYQLRRFGELLKIPVFNRQGYVPDSERPERWFFWPMGVKNPGAVRRFGEHAVSFIGRRHFDDPYLLSEVGVQK